MKTSSRITLILTTLIGTALFDILFWNEDWGINTLFYALFLLIALFLQKRNISITSLITIIGFILSSIAITIFSSLLARWMYALSLILVAGTFHENQIKSILNGFLNGVFNLVGGQISFFRNLFGKSYEENKKKLRTKVFFVTSGIVLIFVILFSIGNPIFGEQIGHILNYIGDLIVRFFESISIVHILFIILGLITSAAVIFKMRKSAIARREATKSLTINREQLKRKRRKKKTSAKKLKEEYRIVLWVFIMMNILTAIVNVIDINWLWFNFQLTEGMDLKQLVHEGTYILIFSIILSSSLIVFYFRGNLNFFHKNKWLKLGANLWTFQNLILVISVAIRNYHYYHYFGLAYKRIGVVIFLVLTVFGLFTVFLKVNRNKSFYFLFNRNSLATYILLIACSFVNWDAIIAKNNFNHPYPGNIEANFLLSLSDKTLPILEKHKEDFQNKNFLHNEYSLEILDARIKDFIEEQQLESFLSWSYADSEAEKTLLQYIIKSDSIDKTSYNRKFEQREITRSK
ncbi:MAG: hypothetical protein C0594_15585 [Marinilabiliales bacterium]|nr:MAG: hypothetical protein C0594_15585 [Marinilabiliales bacterium]